MEQPPPLTPMPLDVLMGRIAHEWATRRRIFDLPTARFWATATTNSVDLSMDFLGRPAATPVGPAAGPHSQMTQNIVLGWLAGARVFELKTVQVEDDLDIARPCIDMETVGFNIEWSQELNVEESLEEYVKAWMIVAILDEWSDLESHVGNQPGPYVFDMSLGYDLAGISSDKVAGYISAMRDATTVIDRLRPLIPEPFTEYRDFDFGPTVADTVTQSTFHGCPPEEMAAITKHLMDQHELDVIVKLNPTLLGFPRVIEILQQQLGYQHIRLDRLPFVEDLEITRAVDLIGELQDHAAANGRRFGIKLTNTLVVDNDKDFLPADPMYLSGPPLHVLATALLDDLIIAMPGMFRVEGHSGPVQVSFSAGVTGENLGQTLGMGVAPATMSSDLLKPGGYGRLEPMLRQLERDLSDAECDSLATWHHHKWETARAAGFRGPVEQHMVATTAGDELRNYDLAGTDQPTRHVSHELEMWGCVACNLCVTVCPNDAFFRLPTPEGMGIAGRQQYFLLQELCNECGNCMVFCPETGDPAKVKPKLFLNRDRFAAAAGQGFLLAGGTSGVRIEARPGFEAETARLDLLLNDASEGLPLRASDL